MFNKLRWQYWMKIFNSFRRWMSSSSFVWNLTMLLVKTSPLFDKHDTLYSYTSFIMVSWYNELNVSKKRKQFFVEWIWSVKRWCFANENFKETFEPLLLSSESTTKYSLKNNIWNTSRNTTRKIMIMNKQPEDGGLVERRVASHTFPLLYVLHLFPSFSYCSFHMFFLNDILWAFRAFKVCQRTALMHFLWYREHKFSQDPRWMFTIAIRNWFQNVLKISRLAKVACFCHRIMRNRAE